MAIGERLHHADLCTPESKEDCQEYWEKLMSDGHDPLTVDFIRLVTVDPLTKRDAAKPEEKECYEAEKDSYDCDHSYPPVMFGLLPSC